MDGGFIIGLLGALATIGSVIALIVKSRGENKNAENSAKAALDARIDERVASQLKEAWIKIDGLEEHQREETIRRTRRDGAFARVLRAIAQQWPTPEGPNLDPADIAEIEETIPVGWIRAKPKEPN